jgi:hypothetical protein
MSTTRWGSGMTVHGMRIGPAVAHGCEEFTSHVPQPNQAALDRLLSVMKQLEPLGRNLVTTTDAEQPLWLLRPCKVGSETTLKLEAGDDALGHIAYWFDDEDSALIGTALHQMDQIQLCDGAQVYRVRRDQASA